MKIITRNPGTGENRHKYNLEWQPDNADFKHQRAAAVLAELVHKRVCEVEYEVKDNLIHIKNAAPIEVTALTKVRSLYDMAKYPLLEKWELDVLGDFIPLALRTNIWKKPVLSKEEVVLALSFDDLQQALVVNKDIKSEVIAHGLPVLKIGVKTGVICLNVKEVKERHAKRSCILIKRETSPDDIEALKLAEAIVTSLGGLTSHAAIIARGWNKCCIVGCNIEVKENCVIMNKSVYNSGDTISVDSDTGNIYVGKVDCHKLPKLNEVQEILDWCSEVTQSEK